MSKNITRYSTPVTFVSDHGCGYADEMHDPPLSQTRGRVKPGLTGQGNQGLSSFFMQLTEYGYARFSAGKTCTLDMSVAGVLLPQTRLKSS
jgi:hypothetical protein